MVRADTVVRVNDDGITARRQCVGGEIRLSFYDDQRVIRFETRAGAPAGSWLRLQYHIRDYWTGEQHIGGLRWWFVCPNENRRVRKLYLPFRRPPVSITTC